MPRVRVVFLGTGNAFNTDGRGSQSIWIEPSGGSPLLVDVGPTAVASMARLGLSPGRVDVVLFTHLHGDHIAGWPFLLLHDVFVGKRTAPLRVFGPTGSRTRLEALAVACYEDLVTEEGLAFPLEVRELAVEPAQGIEDGHGRRFDVVPLEHHPTSIGYRVHAGGRAIAVTGDTRWCPGLEELARGVDLLIVECSSVRRQAYAHVSLEELREGIGRLGSGRIALVHLDDEVARAVRDAPIPGVTAMRDGDFLEL